MLVFLSFVCLAISKRWMISYRYAEDYCPGDTTGYIALVVNECMPGDPNDYYIVEVGDLAIESQYTHGYNCQEDFYIKNNTYVVDEQCDVDNYISFWADDATAPGELSCSNYDYGRVISSYSTTDYSCGYENLQAVFTYYSNYGFSEMCGGLVLGCDVENGVDTLRHCSGWNPWTGVYEECSYSDDDDDDSPSPGAAGACLGAAVAPYKSILAPLRGVRDQKLTRTPTGRNAADLYYAMSDRVLKVTEKSSLTKFVLTVVLRPLVVVAGWISSLF